MNVGQKMVKIYFGQTDHYMSEHHDTLIEIKDMHPTYAANAARRLLIDTHTWAAEAGQEGQNAVRWMLGTPLWNALHAQAQTK